MSDHESAPVETPLREGARWQTRAVLRVIFVTLSVVAALWLLYVLLGIIFLVIVAIFFAYLLAPLVRMASRPVRVGGQVRSLPRGPAIGVVYLVLTVAVASIGQAVIPRLSAQVSELARQAPAYLTALHARIQSVTDMARAYDLPPEAQAAANNAAMRAIESASAYVEEAALGLVGWLAFVPWLILVPVLGFFFLKDGDAMRAWLLAVLPAGGWRRGANLLFAEIDLTIAAYIRAQLIACLIIGAICTVGFAVIGVPFALVLGVLAGVLEFIPLIGPLTLAVIAFVVAAFASVKTALVLLAFLGVLRIAEDYVIYPKIIGQGIHMDPLTVILSVLCGAEIAGLPGVFLSVPIAGIVSVGLRHLGGTKEIVADILKPAPPPAAPVAAGDPPPE